MEKALSDVTVLDLGQVIAMPFCTMLLADMGAKGHQGRIPGTLAGS
jgi:crotonobetainyl-CoA:carnitine CoA-transferase CaiB-like acyl-CoA transferase